MIKVLLIKLIPENPEDIKDVYKTLNNGIHWVKSCLPDWPELEDKKKVIPPLVEYLGLTVKSAASDIAKVLNKPQLRRICEKREQEFKQKNASSPSTRAKPIEKTQDELKPLEVEPIDADEQNWSAKKVICNCIIA